MTTLLFIWISIALATASVRRRRATLSAGLVTAYLVVFFMTHVIAAAMYAFPEQTFHDIRIVQLGFEQAVFGIAAFALGSVSAAPAVLDIGILAKPRAMRVDDTLPKAFIGCGVACFVASATPLSSIPSATAILSTGQNLIIAGLALALWLAWKQRNYRMIQMWLVATIAVPAATVVTSGFLGYGAVAAFTVLVFASQFVRNRLVVVAAGVICCYVGLSVFVTYARDRDAIRGVVWGGEATGNRVDRVLLTLSNFEWFDPSNADHQKRVDIRLNQNYLVGMAADRMGEFNEYANGRTIVDAMVALVPRFLWPDKPMVAGSGTLVSDYTGLILGTTSVGIGQVMELFINFGTSGVVIGFFIIGVLLTVCDTMAARHLAVGDLPGFVVWFLPGISFLQIGGSLMELTTGVVASAVAAKLVNRLLEKMEQRKPPVRQLSRGRQEPRLAVASHHTATLSAS